MTDLSLPSGTVTFLFTDIEGSTWLAQEQPGEMAAILARHHEILHQSIQSHHGYVFQIVGDSFAVAFHSASDALNAALNAQRILQNEPWAPAPIKVRMGIHTGTAQLNEDKQYSGYATLASTQRIMSAGHGGQVLLSGVTRELVRDTLPTEAELLDLGEKRLKDLLHPEHLYQLNISGLLSTFPPLKTLDSFPNNLPTQLTSFIGRENEIAEIKQELDRHRLVTLTGAGGAGKTRLSLEVGATCLEQDKNGVWFVELASLTDPSLIIGAVMSVIGLHEKSNDINPLARYIGNQSLLLVLDNCEHLIEDCARLVESLMKLCPKLHVLATSREAFGIAGEQSYHVPSLPFPDPKHLPSLDEIARCESVQLFVERVKTYIPSFSLTEKNASSIAQICCRLDGIPLAIELAAARVKVMSVEQLAARMGDLFSLLTSGNRTALPRQQTLRALIEWSYDLLSESEKSLFRRLAAFSGGWSLEAAESICSVEGSGTSVLDDLARLVDKSLVVKEEHDDEARFQMLETIRQYAEFKMFASEEVEDVKNRHRDWFMQLAEEAEPKLRTGEQLTWLNRLEMEHDNLRAAIKWSIEQKHVEQALRIPSALAYFWEIHGQDEEGRNWLNQAVTLEAQSSERKYPYAWATAVVGLFSLSYYLSDVKNHKSRLEEALDIFRESGDTFKVGQTLYYLAYIPGLTGEPETARSIYQEGLNAYQSINDSWGMGQCLHCMAHLVEEQGNIEESRTLYNKSVELIKWAGDRFSLYHPVGDMGRLAAIKGDTKAAKDIFQESLQVFEELGSRGWISSTYSELARIYYSEGEYQKALEYFEEAIALSEKSGNLRDSLWMRAHKAYTVLRQGNVLKAREEFENTLRRIQKADNLIGMVFVIEGLASLNVYQAQFERAARLFAWADGIREKIDNHRPAPEQASVEKDLAVIHSTLNDTEFEKLLAEGRGMTMEEIIEFALEENGS